jgi:hypothetical protein
LLFFEHFTCRFRVFFWECLNAWLFVQPTTCSAILTEQMATLWRQTDSECGTLFYQHHVILAVDQVLTDGGDLDMNLSFVA